RADLNSTLKEAAGRFGAGVRPSRTRAVLVISEVALALVLLIGATLLIRSFAGLRNVALGFDPRNVLTLQTSMSGDRYSTSAQMTNFERLVVQRIESLPGVVAASRAVVLPVQNFGIDLPFAIEGRPLEGRFHGDEFWRYVGPRYFDAFRIPLVRGRVFDQRDVENSAKVALINESMARKYWPKGDPLGARIVIGKGLGPEFDDPPRQIVGIVGDVRESGLRSQVAPVMYVPSTQVSDGLTRLGNRLIPTTWVVRSAGDPLSLTAAVEREFLSTDPLVPVANVRTMEQVIRQAAARDNFNMLLLSIFAAVALLLAAIGIYGLMSYSVEQRAHEIGIRLALGADRADVLRLFVLQGARLAAIGLVLGLGVAFGLTRLLGRLLFGVGATDPVSFAAVALLLGAVALLASYIPARRATRVDPVIALRYE
ncbi:MAG: ABC transporter permease, partial [Acidobacteria bacterium]|nr:ABC transporter permease [Acidobacteriota bacterium]